MVKGQVELKPGDTLPRFDEYGDDHILTRRSVNDSNVPHPFVVRNNRFGIEPGEGQGFSGSGALVGNRRGIHLRGDNSKVEDNVIGGGGGRLLEVEGDKNEVKGNKVGTDATGTRALPTGGVVYIRGNDNNIWENVISNSNFDGLVIRGDRNDLFMNRIGTDITGTVEMGNGGTRITVQGNENCIGTLKEFLGMTMGECKKTAENLPPEAANVISSNGGHGIAILSGMGNIVLAATIGTDVSGTRPMGNGGSGVYLGFASSFTDVGESLISGNGRHGVEIARSNDHIVRQNLIGTDNTGLKGLGNEGHGIFISEGDRNVIGGVVVATESPGPTT